jgi:hypothetical protein
MWRALPHTILERLDEFDSVVNEDCEIGIMWLSETELVLCNAAERETHANPSFRAIQLNKGERESSH